jgi:AhpD family alkylhydroperoxidase
MAALNRDAAELMLKHGAHACTDVTGFGLAGHLVEMARNSGVAVELELEALPVFAAVPDCLAAGIMGGGVERNMEYSMAWVRLENESAEAFLPAIYDPQTSGGLLISLPEDRAKALVAELRGRGNEAASIIGKIVPRRSDGRAGELTVRGFAPANLVGRREGAVLARDKGDDMAKETGKHEEESAGYRSGADGELSCCAGGPDSAGSDAPAPARADSSASAAATPFAGPARFTDFMKEVNLPGQLDARVKKLMAIALSVSQKCEPCLKIHLEGARKMGLSQGEIDEAAWMAISFCGAPALMFYNEVRREMGDLAPGT